MTIVEFLEARLDEDEADARNADGDRLLAWSKHDRMVIVDSGFLQAFTRSRILREVAAKRAIIAQSREADEYYAYMSGNGGTTSMAVGHVNACSETVKALAVVYAEHPDYQPDW